MQRDANQIAGAPRPAGAIPSAREAFRRVARMAKPSPKAPPAPHSPSPQQNASPQPNASPQKSAPFRADPPLSVSPKKSAPPVSGPSQNAPPAAGPQSPKPSPSPQAAAQATAQAAAQTRTDPLLVVRLASPDRQGALGASLIAQSKIPLIVNNRYVAATCEAHLRAEFDQLQLDIETSAPDFVQARLERTVKELSDPPQDAPPRAGLADDVLTLFVWGLLRNGVANVEALHFCDIVYLREIPDRPLLMRAS